MSSGSSSSSSSYSESCAVKCNSRCTNRRHDHPRQSSDRNHRRDRSTRERVRSHRSRERGRSVRNRSREITKGGYRRARRCSSSSTQRLYRHHCSNQSLHAAHRYCASSHHWGWSRCRRHDTCSRPKHPRKISPVRNESSVSSRRRDMGQFQISGEKNSIFMDHKPIFHFTIN